MGYIIAGRQMHNPMPRVLDVFKIQMQLNCIKGQLEYLRICLKYSRFFVVCDWITLTPREGFGRLPTVVLPWHAQSECSGVAQMKFRTVAI